jgi:hypothetical protein
MAKVIVRFSLPFRDPVSSFTECCYWMAAKDSNAVMAVLKKMLETCNSHGRLEELFLVMIKILLDHSSGHPDVDHDILSCLKGKHHGYPKNLI